MTALRRKLIKFAIQLINSTFKFREASCKFVKNVHSGNASDPVFALDQIRVGRGGRYLGRGTVSLEMFIWLYLVNQITVALGGGGQNSGGYALLVNSRYQVSNEVVIRS